MANTYFVTPAFLKQNGIFNKNIDELLYTPYVEGVAKVWLKSQIGTHFFNDLYIKYNLQTLSADEQIVVTYMQWSIAYRLKAETVQEATYQLTNKGLQKQNDDNAESVDLKEFQMRYEGLVSRAVQYELELKKWLIDNKDLYVEFISVLNNDSSIKNQCCAGNGTDYSDGQSAFVI